MNISCLKSMDLELVWCLSIFVLALESYAVTLSEFD